MTPFPASPMKRIFGPRLERLQILFMNGSGRGLHSEDEIEPANSRFVQKPFGTSRITEAIETCFAGIRPVQQRPWFVSR